jgi:hypothetical protein
MALSRPLGARVAPRLAVLALLTAGCAPVGLLSYRPDDPLLVSVPLAQAAVRDERAAFAALFLQELRASDPAADLGTWLHGLPAGAPAAAEPLAALRRRFAERQAGTVVLVVPGLFGDCVDRQSVPFGDGVVRPRELEAVQSYAAYADLGLRAIRMVDLPGRASAQANGERLAAEIRAEAARPGVERLVLVAYSKGVPDAQHALQRLQQGGAMPANLLALVSVAGAVAGTPLADHFEGVYARLAPHLHPLDCSASQGQEVASITRRERVQWLTANPPVPGPAYYSIVAYTRRDEVAPPLRLPHDLLSRADPRNDGQMIAADAILPGSVLLATARSDHWDLALPRDRHPDALMRGMSSGRHFPREALLRATLTWVVAQSR